MPTKDDVPHLRIRLEPRMLARLEKAREKSGRTLTGEIVSRLESSFRRDEHEDILKTIEKTIASHGFSAGFAAGFRGAPLLESFKADARRSGLFKDDAQIAAALKRALREEGEEDKS